MIIKNASATATIIIEKMRHNYFIIIQIKIRATVSKMYRGDWAIKVFWEIALRTFETALL